MEIAVRRMPFSSLSSLRKPYRNTLSIENTVSRVMFSHTSRAASGSGIRVVVNSEASFWIIASE